MYDYWYTIGRAIMDPGLLTAVNGADPAPYFERVTRKMTETDSAGNTTTVADNSATAGLLAEDNTISVRSAIWNWLSANPVSAGNPPLPPPISIYTAGRFCQFLTIQSIDFVTRIAEANNAWRVSSQGADPATFSERFPAFIGACLIDGDLAQKVATPGDPDLQDAITQFGINAGSPEFGVANRLVNHEDFITSQGHLLSDPDATWTDTCGDQFFFWVGKNERAVL